MAADVSHSVIFEQTIPLGRDYTPAAAAEAVRRTMREAYRREGLPLARLIGVGVAFSGPVAPDGRIHRASIIPTWAGVNIRDVFEPALERPIYADNESNCSAIAEMTWGAAIGVEDFVLFKIDIGVGGAIVSHGQGAHGRRGGGGRVRPHDARPPRRSLPLRQPGLPRTGRQPQPGACRSPRGWWGARLASTNSWRPRGAANVGFARLLADTAEIAGRGLGMIGAILNPGLILIGWPGGAGGRGAAQAADRVLREAHADQAR